MVEATTIIIWEQISVAEQATAEVERLPFFVYGTLLPYQPNFSLWPSRIALTAPVHLGSAALYDMGSYPMLIEEGVGRVRGALIEVPAMHYAPVVQALDALEMYDPVAPERSLYLRVARQVELPDGSLRRAWVYIGKPQAVVGREAFGGDWVGYASASQTGINAWWAWYRDTAGASLLDKR